MQHAARQTQGYAVLSFKVLVDSNGNPVAWFLDGPARLIEPRNCHELARWLCGLEVE